jgi:Phasin protein
MTTTRTDTDTEPFDAAFEQLKETGEKFAEGARKASNLYLDSYEQAVDHAIELELKLAGLTKQEWLKDVIEAQAELARELTGSYTAAARSFLK